MSLLVGMFLPTSAYLVLLLIWKRFKRDGMTLVFSGLVLAGSLYSLWTASGDEVRLGVLGAGVVVVTAGISELLGVAGDMIRRRPS